MVAKKRENIKEIKKISSEWIKEYDCKIIDYDGWDRKNYDYSFNEEKITREEFERRLMGSTILGFVFKGKILYKTTYKRDKILF